MNQNNNPLSVKLNRSFARFGLSWINYQPCVQQHHILIDRIWTTLQTTFCVCCLFCTFLGLLSSVNGECSCAMYYRFRKGFQENSSRRERSVLLFWVQLVTSKVACHIMLVVLRTVLLASETKQCCCHRLRYSTNTCCQTDKTGGNSKCKLVFVLKVNLVWNKPNFLLILSHLRRWS